MKLLKNLILFVSLLYPSLFFCQSPFTKFNSNFNFEKIDTATKNFAGLRPWSNGYDYVPDSLIKHGGKYSLRIEKSVSGQNSPFGCCVFKIPAGFAGSRIELCGFMKLENVQNGSAGLFMRIDSREGMNQMDNMLNRGINGTSDWRFFSLFLPLAEDDESIYYGAMLSGSGKIWVDDFQILIDGKDISEAKPKLLSKNKAYTDTSFDKGSNISLSDVSSNNLENLTVLGQIWGFLKYYHPEVAAGNINWDYELFRIMPKILVSSSKQDRNNVLFTWIKSLSPGKLEQDSDSIKAGNIKIMPDLKWIEDEQEFGNDLVSVLKEIKYSKRDSVNYYLGFVPGVGNPVFKHESQYMYMSYPDAGFRLLALFRYWNIIQYTFPYKNLISEDWNSVLQNSINDFVKAGNALEYRLALLKIIGKINDTHANIWSYDKPLAEFFGELIVPCKVSFIENKAVVTGIFPQIDSTLTLKVGDIIEKVNGENVDEIVKRKLDIYPASNYPAKLRNIAGDILRSKEKSISITYKRDGSLYTETVSCIDKNAFNQKAYAETKKSSKLLENNIGYIYPGTIKNAELPGIMNSFKNCKGIIIDMRCYPSEPIIYSLSQYLMPVAMPFVKFSRTNLKTPGLFSVSDPISAGMNNLDYYKHKVVIIINEITQSQAEFTTMALRKAPQATVIGSSTAGADGNVSQFNLPGGISTMISGIGIYYPDGKETQGIGIIPDVEVKPTIKGILNGTDELLEKAIEIILEQK